MELNLTQIKTIAFGCARIRQNEEEEFCFLRFPEHLADTVYLDRNCDYYRKTYATAGVSLDFETDTKNLSFDYSLHCGSSQRWGFFTLMLDGTAVEREGEETLSPILRHFEKKLDGRRHRVTLILPCLANMRISHFTVDDGCLIQPVKKDLKFLFLGDSITHGYICRDTDRAYANHLSFTLNADQRNWSIGGEHMNVVNLEKEKDFEPNIVFSVLGTNDWSHLDDESRMEPYFSKVSFLFPKAKKIYLMPFWRHDEENIGKTKHGIPFRQWRTDLKNAALKNGFIVADTWDWLSHDFTHYSPDALHPNDCGNDEIYSHLLSLLQENHII